MNEMIMLKRCSRREHEGSNPLPASRFGRNRRAADGLQSWCKTCRSKYAQGRYFADPATVSEDDLRWRDANLPGWRERQRGAQRHWERAEDDRLRGEVFGHYGHVCACCGTAKDLSIDHVNGEGRAHRLALFGRSNARTTRFYRWLIDQGFPQGYQVLCLPCNGSKGDGPACRLDHGEASE